MSSLATPALLLSVTRGSEKESPHEKSEKYERPLTSFNTPKEFPRTKNINVNQSDHFERGSFERETSQSKSIYESRANLYERESPAFNASPPRHIEKESPWNKNKNGSQSKLFERDSFERESPVNVNKNANSFKEYEIDIPLTNYENDREFERDYSSTKNENQLQPFQRNYPVAKTKPEGQSKHFLSLQIFSEHAEPGLNEFLDLSKQSALEYRQREEEDVLYRLFLKERRTQEPEVVLMDEEERQVLFEDLNRKERSRMINLVDKHCNQMMDLIHSEKIKYLQEDENMVDIEVKYPRLPPVIQPPKFTKDQVYENNEKVFEVVDDTAIKATKQKFESFTTLVRFLVGKFSSDLDKVRAIFRFITEKTFEHKSWFLYYPQEGNTRGAPTQLFRGVEFGIESKALLFKKMCSFAGIHSIVIKGYSKGKDYLPGEEFVDNRYRNTWNGVYVAGGWRFIQPNWGSMQINTKASRETRKIYQDHYFLTDPDKFIFEFFPVIPELQLLEQPISISEFESLPLLRSTFFYFGLGLSRSEGLLTSVITADANGEANIYFKKKENLTFHYSLTNIETGHSSIKRKGGKFPLDRFVMMSNQGEESIFTIFLPQKGSYLLEIGAAHRLSSKELLTTPQLYVNVCKFRIECDGVDQKPSPLPDCVPGEWGPGKAFSLFGLKATSHPLPIINAAPPSNIDFNQEVRPLTLNIEFEKTDEVLDFVTKLYKNGVREKDLKQNARYRNKDKYVIFDIKVPQEGQYGLDIYTRRNWQDKMLHCCKYLINCEA